MSSKIDVITSQGHFLRQFQPREFLALGKGRDNAYVRVALRRKYISILGHFKRTILIFTSFLIVFHIGSIKLSTYSNFRRAGYKILEQDSAVTGYMTLM